jgi:hypothetical protein
MAIDYIKDVVLPQVKELESHASVHEAAAHGAYQMEEEAQEAYDEGYCIHCGEEVEDCTGYKCWIR